MLKKDAQILIKAIVDSKYKLNSWEQQFMQSIKQRDNLTSGQSIKLQEIYSKAYGGGIYEKHQQIG